MCSHLMSDRRKMLNYIYGGWSVECVEWGNEASWKQDPGLCILFIIRLCVKYARDVLLQRCQFGVEFMREQTIFANHNHVHHNHVHSKQLMTNDTYLEHPVVWAILLGLLLGIWRFKSYENRKLILVGNRKKLINRRPWHIATTKLQWTPWPS